MAISLASLNRTTALKPPRILTHGVHGVGKTTLGDVPAKLIEALQAIVASVPGNGRGNIAALVDGPMIAPDPYPLPMRRKPSSCSMRLTTT